MSDPDLTPSEEQVRRLLADARHDEPMPDDVADRLDRVLADLRASARRTPPPVDLGARRRRRVGRNLLVAAAAVVVLGVGISQVDLVRPGRRDDARLRGRLPATARLRGRGGGRLRATRSPAGRRPLALSSDVLRPTEVRRLTPPAPSTPSPSRLPRADAATDAFAGAAPGATTPPGAPGERVAVRYDGQRGVLVLRPASGGDRSGRPLPVRRDRAPTRVHDRSRRAGLSPRTARCGEVSSPTIGSTDAARSARGIPATRRVALHVRQHPERHHHRLRPVRLHRGGVRRPREPAAAGLRGLRDRRRRADEHHRGRELPRLPRRHHGPGPDGRDARPGRALRRRADLRRRRRGRPDR